MAEAIIEIKNANIYQGDNLVLQDVNLHVDRGEFVYLVGKTGTGKSSLLKTMYGELPLKEGQASVVGYNLREMTWKTVPYLRRNLGVVFQVATQVGHRFPVHLTKVVTYNTGLSFPQRKFTVHGLQQT